jgi:hypothetical protein
MAHHHACPLTCCCLRAPNHTQPTTSPQHVHARLERAGGAAATTSTRSQIAARTNAKTILPAWVASKDSYPASKATGPPPTKLGVPMSIWMPRPERSLLLEVCERASPISSGTYGHVRTRTSTCCLSLAIVVCLLHLYWAVQFYFNVGRECFGRFGGYVMWALGLRGRR